MDKKLLAVYWSDLDVVNLDRAYVYWQIYTRRPDNNVQQQNVIERANRDVLLHSPDKLSRPIYDAQTVVVVTWYEVPPWPARNNTGERVTFQCVIITDGKTAYVIYLYLQNAMNFNPQFSRAVEIGWGSVNFVTERSSYYSFDQVIGNTGVPGQWFFKIGESENFEMECLTWYRNNIYWSSLNRFSSNYPATFCFDDNARKFIL
ncbi:uncharacterized protein LOC131942329 [Physella acuta]|uniref:uncharacterized protein LOC131942329 n=1 Tax=Physella acuta TaxID=109671 RepID=UPI0027DD8BD9|nr:uncharacterized protein LOC131942329 [Physella acuta]